jgi:hypothetical protein
MVKRFLIVFLLLGGTAFSQTTFTGTIDGYYAGSLNKPPSRTIGLRAFDFNHNEFSFSYAELAIEQAPMPIGFRVDIGAGDTASVVNSFEPSPTTFYEYLQQAYISANHGGLTFDFGKFVTPIGTEVIETKDNWNYSRSLLFTWPIPFYHFGARVNYAVNDKFTIGGTLTNGWNNVKDNNGAKTVGVSATVKPGGGLTWIGNYMVGNETTPGVFGPGSTGEMRHTFDTTAIYDFNEMVSAMGNYVYVRDNSNGDAHVQGIAAYAKFAVTDKVQIIPRYEWFDDPQGAILPGTAGPGSFTPQTMQEFTLTAKFPVHDQLTFFGEYRRDWSDATVFEGETGLFDEESQNVVTFGLVFNIRRGN